MKLLKLIFIFHIFLILFLFGNITPSLAQTYGCVDGINQSGPFTNDPTCGGMCDPGETCQCIANCSSASAPNTLHNPLDGVEDPNILIGMIINGVLGLVGSLALVMFIYGGFTWMTAAGAAEKVKKGRDIIIWAVLGLIVIFSSYALVKFILSNVFTAS